MGILLLAGLLGIPGTLAELEPAPPQYALDNFFTWSKTDLQVVIVPPTHGPLFSIRDGLLPDGPEGALPTGTYLDATLTAIENWRHAITLHAEQASLPWMHQIQIDERVVLVEDVTPMDLKQADILVVYPEHAGVVLGVAVHTGSSVGPRCVAANTLWLLAESLNRYDMHKLAGHEFGHCLGLGHAVADNPAQDVMSQGGYPNHSYRCPSNLNLEGIEQAFRPAAGQGTGGGQARVNVADYEQSCLPGLA